MRCTWNPSWAAALAVLFTVAAVVPVARATEERQVPLDQRGRIGVVSAALANRLGLFVTDRPGFVEARLLASDDGTCTLELLVREGREVVRSRSILTAAQVDSLRALVQSRVESFAPEAGVNQEGRPWMLGGNALLGLGFYGWAVPVAFDVQDGQSVVGTYLLTSGLSYFVPMAVTQTQPVTYASANLGFYGQTRGILHGALLANAADPGNGDGRSEVSAGLFASVLEGVAMNQWAAASGMSPGRAGTLVTGGDFGMMYGSGIAHLSGAYDDGDDHAGVTALSTMAGYAAGLAGASALASRRDYSYGDAGVMRVGGLVGGAIGASVAALPDDVDDKVAWGAFMAGSLAGLAVGDRAVRGAGYDGGQNVISHLSAAAGGLMGLGVGYLASADASGNGNWLPLASSLGAAGGWALSIQSMPRGGRPAPEAASVRDVPRADAPQWTWAIEPRSERHAGGSRVVPQFTMRARF